MNCSTRAVLIMLLFFTSVSVSAEFSFFENFDTGDSSLADWGGDWFEPSIFDASSGDLVISGRSQIMQAFPSTRIDPILGNLTDQSIRTQVAIDGTADYFGLFARLQGGNFERYVARFNPPLGTASLDYLLPWTTLFEKETDIDIESGEDIVMQFDAIGSELSFYAWQPDQPKPIDPLIRFTDDQFQLVSGGAGIIFDPKDAESQATIRFVQISDTPIQTEFLTGDFVADGILDQSDINRLTQEAASGNNTVFDITNDGLVDQDDIQTWVKEKNTWIGDANLDGEFNSGDFVQVFQFGKFETGLAAIWNQGDWNGDGVFSSGDFVAAFEDGGFELGPKGKVVATVPEPTSHMFLIFGIAALCVLRRR